MTNEKPNTDQVVKRLSSAQVMFFSVDLVSRSKNVVG